MTKRLKTLALVGILGFISFIFVLQFGGPQAEGCGAGGVQSTARVYGHAITQREFKSAERLAGFDRYPAQLVQQLRLKELVLNGLIERTLLSRVARDVGFQVDEEEAMTRFAREGKAFLSLGVGGPLGLQSREVPLPVKDEQGKFDKDAAKRFIQFGLRRTVGEFAESQVHEMLAHYARQLVLSTVTVPESELWDAYVNKNEKVKVGYVKFSTDYFKDKAVFSQEGLEAWMKTNASTLDETYQAQKPNYTNLPEQVRVRHLLLSVAADADEKVRASVRSKIEKLRQRLVAGEDFIQLAKQFSEDKDTAYQGGDLGFIAKDARSEAFAKAVFALEENRISEVFETEQGYHIARVEAKRQGDVPEKQAKRDIAEDLYRKETLQSAARKAAEQALAELNQGRPLNALPGVKAQTASDDEDAIVDESIPRVVETDWFGRSEQPISGPFDAMPFTRAAFALSDQKPISRELIELGENSFVVMKLLDKKQANQDAFDDAAKQELWQDLHQQRETEVMQSLIYYLRRESDDDGAVRIDRSFFANEPSNAQGS